MYNFFFHKLLLGFSNLFLETFTLIPLITLVSFFLITTFFLYFSLKNIFKIFFLTEVLLLITVVFLAQLGVLYPSFLPYNIFYCQLILAAAAAEAALFLGLFSHLYQQQLLTRIEQSDTNFFEKKTH
jgi:NADH:ubiquinone oxidoreductase subunit K